jgi:hypothetical protein
MADEIIIAYREQNSTLDNRKTAVITFRADDKQYCFVYTVYQRADLKYNFIFDFGPIIIPNKSNKIHIFMERVRFNENTGLFEKIST